MVVTDLDGTLLNSTGTVSERNAAALHRAQDAGAEVVIATGRPAYWLSPIIDIGFRGTAICMNGAVTFDINAKELLDICPLSVEVMHEFVGRLERRLPGIALAVEREGGDTINAWSETAYDHPWTDGLFGNLSRSELLAEPAVKLLVRYGDDSSVLAAAAVADGLDLVSVTYSSNAGLIEVAAAAVNKGGAIKRLAEKLAIDAADVVAFGDMPNDLPMLRWAGRAVAVADAHHDVLVAADEVAAGNHDDGVAQVLARWFPVRPC